EENLALVTEEHAERDAWIRRRRRGFTRHAGIFLIVNMAMMILGLLTEAFPWTLVPGLFWAIGLGIHGLVVLTTHADDWNEESRRRRWWMERQQRKHEVAMARAAEKGDRRQERIGQLRQRFDQPAQAKLRVTDGSEAERAAEAEAEIAASREEKRRRR